jgi:eukaryotic-like serine/threonine-protein kinase
VSRAFPCRRCGASIPVPQAALLDPGASLVCPGCGQRYARKGAATRSGGSAPTPTAAKFTSAPAAVPSALPPPAVAAAVTPTRSLGGVADAGRSPGVFGPGDFVGNRYRVVRFVARGGMGEVYEAEDLELRGRVALKTIHAAAADEPGAVERFKREIQLARRVTHPNVCRIFDVGYHELAPERPPLAFLTMELLEGETLAARLRRAGRLAPPAALAIARQLAEALAAAHEAGVVHRDFKPENVFLVPGREGERAVITDFGIARPGGEERLGATLTSDGNVIGTPAYMAPEQVEGGKITPAADQYAFGVVLFEMVTGELPFRGDGPLATAARRLTEPPPTPRRYAPELDARWESVILRCLERRPEDRFRDLRAAGRALAGEESATLPRPTSAPAPAAPPTPVPAERPVSSARERRRRWLAAALVVALAGASAWSWMRVREIRDRLAASAPAVARKSVAVLGLRNLAERAEAAWLSTALAEMLATELGAGARLRVVPGDSVARALDDLELAGRDRVDGVERARLRRRLGADYLVVGAYTALVEGDALRLDLRLEDARSSETLATVGEHGGVAQLFELVARSGDALRRALGAEEAKSARRRALPGSPEAARFYAEGLDALRAFEPQRARELLERAVAADPASALARSALSTAWGTLGYPARAAQEAQRARDLAADLPIEERLIVEARYLEAAGDWRSAAESWGKLWAAFPDVAAHGLRVAACRIEAGEPDEALAALALLRDLPPPDGEDPRIDLLEASAAGALADFRRQAEAAGRAVERAERDGALLVAAEGLVARGWALRHLGRSAEARTALERARALYAERGHRAGVSAADSALGGVLLDAGEPESARGVYERALVVARDLGDRSAEAQALNNLAVLARTRGENEAARASYERVVAIFEETEHRGGRAVAANNLAVCLTELGELDAAEARAREALAAWSRSGDRSGLGAVHGTLGGIWRRRGQLAEAERSWNEALALRRETGQRPGEAVALNGLGQTQLERGDLGGAARSFALAAAIARELGARSLLASALVGQAELAWIGDDEASAVRSASAALTLRRELGERAGAARLRAALARAALVSDPDGAARAAGELLAAPAEELPPDVAAAARAVLARARLTTGDFAGARRALDAPELEGRLGLAQELDGRLARAQIELAAGRRIEARSGAEEVRAAAAAAGLAGLELDAALVAALASDPAALVALAERALAAGYRAVARRATAAARGEAPPGLMIGR